MISKMAIRPERELFQLFLFIDSEESESDYESDDELSQVRETHDESTSDEVEVRVTMIFFENFWKINIQIIFYTNHIDYKVRHYRIHFSWLFFFPLYGI